MLCLNFGQWLVTDGPLTWATLLRMHLLWHFSTSATRTCWLGHLLSRERLPPLVSTTWSCKIWLRLMEELCWQQLQALLPASTFTPQLNSCKMASGSRLEMIRTLKLVRAHLAREVNAWMLHPTHGWLSSQSILLLLRQMLLQHL